MVIINGGSENSIMNGGKIFNILDLKILFLFCLSRQIIEMEKNQVTGTYNTFCPSGENSIPNSGSSDVVSQVNVLLFSNPTKENRMRLSRMPLT